LTLAAVEPAAKQWLSTNPGHEWRGAWYPSPNKTGSTVIEVYKAVNLENLNSDQKAMIAKLTQSF
jgi:hypothetical protein